MKRIIITLSFIAALGLNVNAQSQSTQSSDGFFSSTLTESTYRTEGSSVSPLFPQREQFTDQDADVPVGSGLLLLAGMGAAYALRKKRK